jgi:hypothetical protein
MNNEEKQIEIKRLKTIIDLEVKRLNEKAEAIKNEISFIDYIDSGGHPIENIVMEMNVRKVTRVLNEKLNNETLITGGEEPLSEAYLFEYDSDEVEGDCSITFTDGKQHYTIHSIDDVSNTFKEVYDITVKKLKEQLAGNNWLNKFKNF